MHCEEGFFGAPRRSSVLVNRRKELLQYYLTMLALTAPGAAIVWFVFHGYVDPMTQMGITLGYWVMIGGTVILAGTAGWSAIQLVRLLIAPPR